MARADKSACIATAVAAIQSGEFIDYSKATAKYKVNRTTISKRIRGLTRSRQEANSFFQKCLTDKQEELLVLHINSLTNRGMPPTSSIVRNLIKEIRGRSVGKN